MASVTGIGAWYPDAVRTNAAWPEDFGRERAVGGDRIFNDIPESHDPRAITARHLAEEAGDPFLGAVERRVAADDTRAIDAELSAAEMALSDAGILAKDLGAIISYSMVPDRLMPASATALAHALGCKSTPLTFGLDAACATLIPQLATAIALVDSGAAEHVLLTQSHLLLRAFPMLHPAAPGLGDAATALVVSRQRRWPVLATHSVTSGEYYDAVTWVRGVDERADVPWWKAGGDYRLGSRDKASAKRLMRDTVGLGGRTLWEVCAKAGVDAERIETLCSVQPRGWIPGAIASYLGLRPETAVSSFERYAHVGACGPIANWHHATSTGPRGGILALYAQGAGFTRGAALISLDG